MISDGLEMQLLVLRDIEETAAFSGDSTQAACATCYQVEGMCVCSTKPTLWPVGDVANRLEQTIRRLRSVKDS